MNDSLDLITDTLTDHRVCLFSTSHQQTLKHSALFMRGSLDLLSQRAAPCLSVPRHAVAPLRWGRIRASAFEPHQHAAELSQVLQMPQNQFMKMVASEPGVFGYTPKAMRATMEGISHLCGIRISQVPELAAARPRLLLEPDLLRLNFTSLMQQLGLPRDEVQGMVMRCPQLLALEPPQLAGQLHRLTTILFPGRMSTTLDSGSSNNNSDQETGLLSTAASLVAPQPSQQQQRMHPGASSTLIVPQPQPTRPLQLPGQQSMMTTLDNPSMPLTHSQAQPQPLPQPVPRPLALAAAHWPQLLLEESLAVSRWVTALTEALRHTRHTGDRQAGDKQAGDKQAGDKQAGNRQAGDKQSSSRPMRGAGVINEASEDSLPRPSSAAAAAQQPPSSSATARSLSLPTSSSSVGAGADAANRAAGSVAQLLLSKPSLVGIPVEVVSERIFHLSKRSGWPVAAEDLTASAAGTSGSDDDPQAVHVGILGYGNDAFLVGGHDSRRCVLGACARGPDLLAVTSCFLDRRATEIVVLLQLEGHREYYEMLLACPALLLAPSGGLLNKWRTLCAVVGERPQLAPQTGPASLAVPGTQTELPGTAAAVEGEVPGLAGSPSTAAAITVTELRLPQPVSTPSAASSSGSVSLLRPEIKAALLSRGFSTLARLKYLVEMQKSAAPSTHASGIGEASCQSGGGETLAQGGETQVSAASPAAAPAAATGPASHLAAPKSLEALAYEVLSSDALYRERYPGFTAWLES